MTPTRARPSGGPSAGWPASTPTRSRWPPPRRAHRTAPGPHCSAASTPPWTAGSAPVGHRRVVHELLAASGVTAAGERPVVPPERYDDLLEVAERWTKLIADAGHDVVGDPTDLLPRPTAPARVATAEPTSEDLLARTTDVLADVLVEVVRLREHATVLEGRNARLKRKRRRLKQRLADATSA